MDYEKQIDRVIELANKIELDRVTVLTGRNGSGKSLVRKILPGPISEKAGTDIKHTVASVSMESRTQKKYDFGALSALGIDDPTNPTGSETIHNIEMIMNAVGKDNRRYLVIDEPEIGCGEELVMAIVDKMNGMFGNLPDGCLGILVITHNRHIVKNLKADFINIEGMTKDEWLGREVVPVDIETFRNDALELYRAINKRVETKKL